MKKFILPVLLIALLSLSGCSLFEDEYKIDEDNVKIYEIHDKFKQRYGVQKAYFDTHQYDEVGRKDLEETEKNYTFLREVLNEGFSCGEADYRYDQLGYYFPWYKAISTILNDEENLLTDTAVNQEFCYSNLTGTGLFSYLDASELANEYLFYGYLGGGITKKYYSVIYEEEVDCSIGEWTDEDFKFSCKYSDSQGALIEDKYSYDFFFETGTLLETCKGEGEEQVCEANTQ